MNRSRVILVSSAGRRVQLIECFRSSARVLGLDLRVVAVDVDPHMSSACQAADTCFQVPRCTTPEFVPELVAICTREQVQLVVPTIDTELEMLADHEQEFAATGTRVVISSPSVVRMARDKAATSRFLSEQGIPTPRTALLGELLQDPDSWCWPVVLKPVKGSSSVGIRPAENLDDALLAATEREDYVAQELLRGREYTVNLFFDQAGILRAAVPHYRYEVRAGEVSKGITERQPTLVNLAWRLGSALREAYGPLCFQAILSKDGQARIFEINARFGGGYPLAHQAGAPFAQWLLEETAGIPSSADDHWEEGLAMLRYDAAFFRKFGVDA
jgi:carbamoyl-phosphate synthase large subunit